MDKERNKIIAQNIKKYLREKNMTQKELADKINISPSTISDYMNLRSNPSHGVIQRIADYFNVQKSDIDSTYKTGPDFTGTPTPMRENNESTLVPIVGGVHAGTPNYAVEDIEGYMALPPNKQSSDGLIYLRVKSDSMDKQFPVDSYVLVDTYADVENGNVAVVKVNGEEATLKQVKFDYENNRMYLLPNSNNETHFPQVVDIDNSVSLVGKVIGMYMDM